MSRINLRVRARRAAPNHRNGTAVAAVMLSGFASPLAAASSSPGGELIGALGCILLAAQAGMLVHLLTSRRIGPCFKASYCMFFLVAVIAAWCAALAIMASMSRLWLGSAVLLLVPGMVWLYALTRGTRLQQDAPPGGPPTL